MPDVMSASHVKIMTNSLELLCVKQKALRLFWIRPNKLRMFTRAATFMPFCSAH